MRSIFFRDFNDIFDDMQKGFAAVKADPKSATTYSKTVTRSFNSLDGIGEERIHEVDGFHGKETKAVTRRLGVRAKTVTDVKDLKTGEVKTTHVRREMTDADDADFDAKWAAASSGLPKHLSAGGGHDEKKQIADNK